MNELLHQLFALVCGQNLAHTWAPGDFPLPCCQRCTGLYVGAFLAAALQVWLRPAPTARFLEVHGGFLLLMVPFGYHWLPQGPVLRTVTGILFGFGLVAFLALPIWTQAPNLHRAAKPGRKYALAVAGAVLCVPWLAARGGEPAASLLSILLPGGFLALAILVLANARLAAAAAFRWTGRRRLFAASSTSDRADGSAAANRLP